MAPLRCLSAALVCAALGGCPVAVAPLDQSTFSCAEESDCADGYSCAGGRCVAAGQDAGLAGADVLSLDSPGVDALGQDSATSDVLRPDVSALDTLLADGAAPDTWLPDAAAADAPLADTSTRDTLLPDGVQPDTELPDSNLPDSNLPDTNLPDTNLPDVNLPDTNLPDSNLPDASLPDGCTPPTGPTWWDIAYASRFPLDVGAAPAGYTVELRLADAAAAAMVGRSVAGGDDLRIVHHDGSPAEIDRDLIVFTASLVIIRFKIQEGGGFGGGNQTYYLYIGNSSPAAAPTNLHNVYLFFDDFEGFTAGDDGSPTYAQSPSTAWRIYDDGGNQVMRASDGGRMMLNLAGYDRSDGAIDVRMKYETLGGTDFVAIVFWGENMDRDWATATAGSIHANTSETGISYWTDAVWNGFQDSSPFSFSIGPWYETSARFVGTGCSFSQDWVEVGSIGWQPTSGQLLGLGAFDIEVYFDDLKLRMAREPEPAVALEAEEEPCG